MYLALRKCKNDCKILKIILVPGFCPLKPEIARFSIGFRLNLSIPKTNPKLISPYDTHTLQRKQVMRRKRIINYRTYSSTVYSAAVL